MTHPDAFFLVLVVLTDLLVGDPYCIPHPVVMIGRLITFLDRWLRLPWLPEKLAGIVMLITVMTVTAGAVSGLLVLSAALHPLVAWFSALFISSSCLASRSLHRESTRVADALAAGDLFEARRYLSYIVGRDTENLPEHEIWRAVVETVAENTSDGIVAPLFWLAIGGPVAAMVYKAVSTLDSMVGYKNQRYVDMGWASARMDDLLNFIPARIAALLMSTVAPVVGGSLIGAIRIVRRDRLNHPSPNSGHPEAAAAGALQVRLGGLAYYGGVASMKLHIGDSIRPLDGTVYRDMIKLMYCTTILMAACCCVAAYVMRGVHVPFL